MSERERVCESKRKRKKEKKRRNVRLEVQFKKGLNLRIGIDSVSGRNRNQILDSQFITTLTSLTKQTNSFLILSKLYHSFHLIEREESEGNTSLRKRKSSGICSTRACRIAGSGSPLISSRRGRTFSSTEGCPISRTLSASSRTV